MRHTLLAVMLALAPALSAQATGQRTREQIQRPTTPIRVISITCPAIGSSAP